ncbi:hypothetical protein [Kitasatospora sp. NE20-6]|uniref:hypothetical protein n=1 Tax=Kitasatospora sp. NE20-6 TaxID=2859066 RepID=UPI0038B39783
MGECGGGVAQVPGHQGQEGAAEAVGGAEVSGGGGQLDDGLAHRGSAGAGAVVGGESSGNVGEFRRPGSSTSSAPRKASYRAVRSSRPPLRRSHHIATR